MKLCHQTTIGSYNICLLVPEQRFPNCVLRNLRIPQKSHNSSTKNSKMIFKNTFYELKSSMKIKLFGLWLHQNQIQKWIGHHPGIMYSAVRHKPKLKTTFKYKNETVSFITLSLIFSRTRIKVCFQTIVFLFPRQPRYYSSNFIVGS